MTATVVGLVIWLCLGRDVGPGRAAIVLWGVAVAELGLNRQYFGGNYAATGGPLVLKDVFTPGWSATLNGQDVPIVRVNGLVRGVFAPAAGTYAPRFTYLTASFTYGVYLSLATAALLAAVVVRGRQRTSSRLGLLAGESGTADDRGRRM